ncbi:polyprenyl synthetase family protein [Streptomyces sp. ISL-11]|uniref:polyprenyl synthetase family protein n=1 Tax=Streptomyces sp. ISL-11 TaxID=2819174 RepID=UPI001BE61A84|nr:polyprenyl synthetase family protein [Streptomyces sp. ISL-11]MBT2383916.1 polyprenyl synthetase family protein [Streptomyces sp. ISL-11]
MRRTGPPEHPSPAASPDDGEWADRADLDVSRAVGRVLDDVLGERLAQAAGIDPTFARDVAARVARFTTGGGKRIRSRFLWWGFRACPGAEPGRTGAVAALRLAAAVELVQTCALAHDDVMDGSGLRRGAPSLHARFAAQYPAADGAGPGAGFATAAAVLAGDLSLAWADDLVTATELPAATRHRVHASWRAMRTEMAAGQYLDVQGQVTGSRSPARALRVAYLKSALYSVERPLHLGMALAGADARTVRAVRAAGRCAGLAFQLRDDILGLFGDPRATGKPSGGDIRDGKATYLMTVARSRARADGDRDALTLIDGCLGDARLPEARLARLRDTLTETGTRARVEREIDGLVRHSCRLLESAPLEPVARHRLQELIRVVAGARPAGSAGTGRADDRVPLARLVAAARGRIR